jgi:hypothetical protein
MNYKFVGGNILVDMYMTATNSKPTWVTTYEIYICKWPYSHGGLSISGCSGDTKLCHFCSHNAIENEAISCRNVPYTSPLEIKFHHYLRMSSQGTSRLSFYRTHRVNGNLCLAEATTLPPLWRINWFETIMMDFHSSSTFAAS